MRLSPLITVLLIGLLPCSQLAAQKKPFLLNTNPNPNFQPVAPYCGTDAWLLSSRKTETYRRKENLLNRDLILSPTVDEIITLPVVVHIINNSPTTITDQMVIAGIKDLNDAYSKAGVYKTGTGVDTKIRFCLAKTDPDGGITSGITRTTHFYGHNHNPSLEESRLKSLIQWDSKRYINIWLINNMEDEGAALFFCGTPGNQWMRFRPIAYATMPVMHGLVNDGIITQSFGATLAHEMGHYLGLYHTYEGGCNNNDCSVDGDKVCDTPPDNNALSACNQVENTCNTDSIGFNPGFKRDQLDHTNNFMDFGGCPNEFTLGQTDRMRKMIVGIRNSLLVNQCDPPCNQNIVAAFTRDNAYPTPGTTINFTNTSTGATTYQWLVNDVQVSTAKNFSYTFAANGKTKITLKAFNGSTCFGIYTDYVTVACSAAARFWVNKRDIASLGGLYTDSILFSNTSVNATTNKWLLSNNQGMSEQVVSTTTGNLLYTFLQPATYYLRLVASNSSCADTTGIYEIHVYDPTPDGISFVNNTECFNDSTTRIEFSICNNGYMPLKKGSPVTFYDDDPQKPTAKKIEPTFYLPYDLGGGPGYYCCNWFAQNISIDSRSLKQVYIVFNDSGKSAPVVLPNSSIVEKYYNNNVNSFVNTAYRVITSPASITAAPEDTIQLISYTIGTQQASTFQWSTNYNIACPGCNVTNMYADTNTVKQVIATNLYGCKDTAYVTVKVPPAYDFTIALNDVQCAANDDSLYVNFSLFNNFKRDFLPKGLKVAFYKNDPLTGNAVLLPPVFSVPATLRKKPFDFTTFIKGMSPGVLYAVVNDDGSTIPLKLPNDTTIKEINYGNNTTSFNYKRITVKASNSSPVCERDSIQLSAVSIPAATYTWKGAGNFTSTQQNPSVGNAGLSLNGYHFVTASLYGCTSVPDSTLITVYPAPITTVDYTRPLCETKPLQLLSNSTNGVKYAWTGPNFSSSIQNPLIATAAFSNSGNYGLIATSAQGCTSLPVSVKVTVNPLPVAGFIDTITCLPSTIANFYNRSSIATGTIAAYQWNFGDAASGASNISTAADPVHVFTKAGSYNVTLIATSDSGCVTTTSNIFKRFHPKPKAAFSFAPTNNLCVNDDLTLQSSSNGADGNIIQWTWNFGDGNFVSNATDAPAVHRYTLAGSYPIALIIKNNFGCGDTTGAQTTVYPLPMVDAGERQYILLGNSTALNPTASGNAITYLWTPPAYLSNPTIPTSAVVRPADDMLYTLTVTSLQQCKASDTVFIKILKPLQIPNAFSPNGDGINDVWNVKYLADYPGAVVDIFDRYGKVVYHTVGYNKPWDGTRNGAPVPTAVYYYIITPKNGAAIVTGSVTVVR